MKEYLDIEWLNNEFARIRAETDKAHPHRIQQLGNLHYRVFINNKPAYEVTANGRYISL